MGTVKIGQVRGGAPAHDAETSGLRLSAGLRIIIGMLLVLGGATVAGFKPIGRSPDLENYEIMFEWAQQSSWDELVAAQDAAFYLLNASFSALGLNFSVFALALALVTSAVKILALKEQSLDRVVLVSLYLTYLFWLHDYTQIRFALAMSMVLYALYGRNRALRVASLLLAPLFHVTSLAVLYLYALARWFRPMVVVTVILAAGALLTIDIGSMLGFAAQRLVVHSDLLSVGVVDSINLWALMPMLQTMMLVGLAWRYRELEAAARIEFKLALAGSAAFYGLSFFPVVAFRVHEMFIVFFLVLCARQWRGMFWLRLLVLGYAMVGLRTTFFGESSLLFAQ